MDLILEGQLSENVGMKEVLQAVLRQAPKASGILRVSCPRDNLNGRLALVGGQYIVGGQISESDECGYQAVRKLLSVREGNFAFLETSKQHPLEMDQSLHISLSSLQKLLPELPADAADLFDERSLLDEVFGPGDIPPSQALEESSRSEIKPERAAPINDKAQPAWHMLSSLLNEQAPATKPPAPLLGAGARTHDSRQEQKISLGKLAPVTLPAVKLPRWLIWLLLLLALTIAALIVSQRS